MRNLTAFFLIFLLMASTAIAQNDNKLNNAEEDKNNVLYFEIFGNGVVYSVNYERIFPLKSRLSGFVRIGGSKLLSQISSSGGYYGLSEAGILLGKAKNFLDAGVGFTMPFDKDDMDRFFVIRSGFRYSGPRGLYFRLSPMYIFNTQRGDVFGNNIWFGLSCGYSF